MCFNMQRCVNAAWKSATFVTMILNTLRFLVLQAKIGFERSTLLRWWHAEQFPNAISCGFRHDLAPG